MAQVKRECPVCNEIRIKITYHIHKYEYMKCQNCGTLFIQNNINNFNQYNHKYFSGKDDNNFSGYPDYIAQSAALKRNFKKYLIEMKNSFSFEKKNLLDIGCAHGFFLDEARRKGFDVFGYDISVDAIKWMNKNLGINGISGKSPAIISGKYDVIMLSEVFEHISEPNTFLGNVKNKLKKNGYIIIVTGNCDSFLAKLLRSKWWYLNPPDHCIIYSRKSLKMILENNQFQIIKHINFKMHWVDTGNLFFKLARIFNILILKKLSCYMPSISLPIYHGTTQFIIAQKK